VRHVEFRKLVDAVIEAHCGLGSMDLPDFDLWSYFDEDMTSEEAQEAARDAAIDLLVEEGFPFEEGA
jgi:hypothetical protein